MGLQKEKLRARFSGTDESNSSPRFSRDEGMMVSLDVVHNLELEGKILAFGSHVEVLKPRLLRHRIAQSLLTASAQYQKV